MKMRISGSPAVMAIYTDGDDTPFTAPASNISRVKIHSSLPYVGAVSTTTGTYSHTDGNTTATLFAHGQSYTPLCLGYITFGGVNIPINCTIPLQVFSGIFPGGSRTMDLNVVADAANVVLDMGGDVSFAGLFPGFTYTILVMNYGFNSDGSYRSAPYFDGVRITPTRVQAGEFDTDAKYLQVDATGAIPVLKGPSWAFGIGIGPGSDDTIGLEQRFSVNGHVVHLDSTRTDRSPFPTMDETFTATIVDCDV